MIFLSAFPEPGKIQQPISASAERTFINFILLIEVEILYIDNVNAVPPLRLVTDTGAYQGIASVEVPVLVEVPVMNDDLVPFRFGRQTSCD